jgi:hypothetical protein
VPVCSRKGFVVTAIQPMSDQFASNLLGMTDPIGLCAACRHARVVQSARGSTFYLCRLAENDPRYAKYPRLPVQRCAGYESVAETGDEA